MIPTLSSNSSRPPELKSKFIAFSTPSGYGYTNGHKTTAEQFSAIFEGLSRNGLITYSHALTGYIPGAEALRIVAQQVERMRSEDPDITYLLDREAAVVFIPPLPPSPRLFELH